MRFSRIEIEHLIKSWIIISIAFTFVLTRGDILISALLSFVGVGSAFLLHELGHKFTAQRYGAFAEYRAFDQMLYLALGLAVFTRLLFGFGILFAAPGAVFISGYVRPDKYGKISFAGPFVNFSLALISLVLLISGVSGFFQTLVLFMFQINAWIGLFNMIPFGNFDGLKILTWSRLRYGLLTAALVIMVFFVPTLFSILIY